MEINPFRARRLMQRQNEGHLPPFPARSRHADPTSEVWEAADEIMQYVEAVRPPEGSKDPEWVVHILGPDDIHRCVGEFDALRQANQHNKAFAKLMADDPSPNDPYCVALAKNRASEEV